MCVREREGGERRRREGGWGRGGERERVRSRGLLYHDGHGHGQGGSAVVSSISSSSGGRASPWEGWVGDWSWRECKMKEGWNQEMGCGVWGVEVFVDNSKDKTRITATRLAQLAGVKLDEPFGVVASVLDGSGVDALFLRDIHMLGAC